MRAVGLGYLILFIVDGALTVGAVWSDAIDVVSDWTTIFVALSTLAVFVLALMRKLTPWVPYVVLAGLYLALVGLVFVAAIVAMATLPEGVDIPDDVTTRVLAERIPWLRPLMIGDGVLTMIGGTGPGLHDI